MRLFLSLSLFMFTLGTVPLHAGLPEVIDDVPFTIDEGIQFDDLYHRQEGSLVRTYIRFRYPDRCLHHRVTGREVSARTIRRSDGKLERRIEIREDKKISLCSGRYDPVRTNEVLVDSTSHGVVKVLVNGRKAPRR